MMSRARDVAVPFRAVLFFGLVAAMFGACAPEYIGVARAPKVPLPPRPTEEAVQAVRLEDGVKLPDGEWQKILANTEKLRTHIDRLEGLIKLYNSWVEQQMRPTDEGTP